MGCCNKANFLLELRIVELQELAQMPLYQEDHSLGSLILR